MGILESPSFLITYAVVQTLVFLLLIRFLDLYEHEPLSILGVMALWGAIGATSLSAIGNGIVREVLPPDIDLVFGPAISAPLVEELAKGSALIAAFTFAAWGHRRFGIMQLGGVTDGIVYGAAVGLGFAFTEDIHYLLSAAASEGLDAGLTLFLSRRDFFGTGMLQHAIYTAAFGAGLGLATWSRTWVARVAFPAIGLILAMTLHGINNGLVRVLQTTRHGFDETVAFLEGRAPAGLQREMLDTEQTALTVMWILDYVVGITFFVCVALWLHHQRRVIRAELAEEIDSGLIDPRDTELVPSYLRRVQWYWRLFRVGELERLRSIRRLHIELAKLAFLKWRVGRDERTRPDVNRSRQKIANLKAQSAVDVYAPR